MSAITQARWIDSADSPANDESADRLVYDSIAELIPSLAKPSPVVRIGKRFNPHEHFELLLKLEGLNPFGSIKDRTAQYMLNGLQLGPDQALVEPTAGNTGIALAALANAMGTPHLS